MDFRVQFIVEVEQAGNGLAIQTPVPIQLVREHGQWRGVCESPPVKTLGFDDLEQALVACSQQVAAEAQGEVMERSMGLNRITPEDIPKDMFR